MIVKGMVSHVLALERIARSLKNEASRYFLACAATSSASFRRAPVKCCQTHSCLRGLLTSQGLRPQSL
jgi:hypothetical protein